MLRNISITALAVVAMAGCVTADKKMNDLEIAYSAYTAGNLDIRYAHMALALSETECVRRFAETMIRDHSAVNDQAMALITKLKVTPQNNPLSQTLVKGASEKRNELSALRGKAFDCAYAQNELGYHQVVNKTVANEFIPNTTVPELKSLLPNTLATFKVHEGHAGKMVEGLKCG